MIITGRNHEELETQANITLTKLKNKLESLKLKLNPAKSHFLKMFTNRNNRYKTILKINNTQITEKQETKILGITITNRLGLTKHYKNMKTDTQKTINILKTLTHSQGGTNPETLLNIYKSIAKSKTDLAYVLTEEEDKTANRLCQTIKNTCIRTCLGLTKTTPVPTLLAEATEMTTIFDNRKKTMKYIIKHLYRNTKIGNDIKTQKSLEKLNKLYIKYPNLSLIKPTHNKVTNPNNLKIEPYIKDIKNKTQTKPTELKKLTEKHLEKYKNYGQIYTDGSLNNNIPGIGIYVQDTNLKISIKLKNHTDIKTTELIAIKIATVIAQLNDKTSIVILTDSQSACKSLRTAMENLTERHYENQILDTVKNNKQKEIYIQWIPGHSGIQGNDIADLLAQKATINPTHTLDNEPTIIDTTKNIEKLINQEWVNKYREMTRQVGQYYTQTITTPPKKLWFKNTKFNAKEVKQITRLRTGHTYNKKYKHRIGLEDSPNCTTCDTVEDNEHIIDNCTKYDSIRTKYTLLRQYKLNDILTRQIEIEYKTLLKFIKEIKYKL